MKRITRRTTIASSCLALALCVASEGGGSVDKTPSGLPDSGDPKA